MDTKQNKLKVTPIHYISSTDSTEFTHLTHSLRHSTIIALDAEWKPIRTQTSCFPTVSILQLACRVKDSDDLVVFIVDLLEFEDVPSIWEILKEMFVSSDVLKLGFRFKQDLVYLSSTFSSRGCKPGFDKVEPYMDIASVYRHLQHKPSSRKSMKENKSLSAICEEVLKIHLSKELQCSDWSYRPLTEEQKAYAAADAQCLVEIFDFFQKKVLERGTLLHNISELNPPNVVLGLEEVFENVDHGDDVLRQRCFQASDLAKADISLETTCKTCAAVEPFSSNSISDAILSKLVQMYGERLLLTESDRIPNSKKKGKRQSSIDSIGKQDQEESYADYQGPPPWDSSLGGDGFPKFLCDLMVEGLAKHLRSVGIDAAIPNTRKPEPRQLIDQAHKEKRVLLTRDAKLLKHGYLIRNQIYRLKSLLKNDQLVEVIQKFDLNICEDQLLSRCGKCNGSFIQKPLTLDEATEASKGFQIIPSCLFDRNIEFWQCMDCKQLYWQGTQYHNAIQKFVDICKLTK